MPDSERVCNIRYNPFNALILSDINDLFSSFNSFYEYAGKPFAKSIPRPGGGYDAQSPQVVSVQMASPLIVDLASHAMDATVGVAALKVAAYLFKHPEQLGSFMPNIRAGWTAGNTNVVRAQQELAAAQQKASGIAARGDIAVSNMEALEQRGSAIDPANSLYAAMVARADTPREILESAARSYSEVNPVDEAVDPPGGSAV